MVRRLFEVWRLLEEKQYLYYISIAVVFLTYRAPSLVVSDIRYESKGYWFESGC